MITLIVGGSGSGKSEFAEQYVIDQMPKDRYYIATMYPYDEECNKKIARHRAMRSKKNFETIECYTHMDRVTISTPKNNTIVLLECMSNLLANEMYSEEGRKENTVEQIVSDITELSNKVNHLVIVSNDVFKEGTQYDESMLPYIESLGQINTRIAAIAERVIEVVYSIPIYEKGESNDEKTIS